MPTAPTRYFSNKSLQPAYDPKSAVKLAVKMAASTTYLAGQIVAEAYGTNEVQSLAITGTPTSGTFTMTYSGQTTGAIAYNATAAAVQTALNALTNVSNSGQQTLALGAATGGTLRLYLFGQETSSLAYNATAAQVQTALLALPGVPAGSITVTGTTWPSQTYTVQFGGALANVPIPAITYQQFTLVPSTITLTVTVTNPGGGPNNIICTGGPLPGTAVTCTFSNRLGQTNVAQMTTTDSFGGGSSPASAVTTTTGGVAGTQLWSAHVPGATDGTGVARGALEHDVATDSAGVMTLGQQTGGDMWGGVIPSAAVFVKGFFFTSDLKGLTDTGVSDLGRMVQGSIAAGGVLEIR